MSEIVTISIAQHTSEVPVSVFDKLPIRIYVKDAKGQFTYMNSRCADDLGLAGRPEAAIGTTDADYFRSDLVNMWRKQEEILIATQLDHIDQEEEEINRAGHRRWVRTVKLALTSPTGCRVGLIGVTRDITASHVTHEFLEHLLNTVPSMIFAKEYKSDTDTFHFSFVNRAVCEAFGRDQREILGKTDRELLGDTIEARGFHAVDSDVMRERLDDTRQEQFQHATKGCRHLTTTKVPLYDPRQPGARAIGILGVSTDITSLHHAELRLRDQAQTLDLVLSHSPAGIFIKDRSGTFQLANAALAQLVGASDPSELRGMRDSDYFSAEYCRESAAEEAEILRTGQPQPPTTKVTDVNGNSTIRLVSKVPLLGPDGEYDRILGVSQDITPLMLAEARLRKQTSVLETLLNTLPQKIFAKGLDGKYLLCNSSFAKRHGGMSPEDIVGKTDFDLWDERQARRYRTKDTAIIEQNVMERFLEEQVFPDGSRHVLETTKAPLRDPDTGTVFGVVGVYDDFLPAASIERVKKQTITSLCSQVRESTDMPRRYFLFLLGLTHIHGMEFNRAILWKYDSVLERMTGVTAVGQMTKSDADALGSDLQRIEVDECVQRYDTAALSPDAALIELAEKTIIDLDQAGELCASIRRAEATREPQLVPVRNATSNPDIDSFASRIGAGEVLVIVVPLSRRRTIVVFCDNIRTRRPVEHHDLQMTQELCTSMMQSYEYAMNADEQRLRSAKGLAWQEVSWKVAHKLDSILPQGREALGGLIETLRANQGAGKAVQELERLLPHFDLAVRLVREFRGYAKPQEVHPVERARAEDLVALFRSAFGLPSTDCETEVCPEAAKLHVMLDRDRMRECAQLMAQNAHELGWDDLQVRIELEIASSLERLSSGYWNPKASVVRLTIADNGPGIPREFKAEIFDPGYSTKPRGTGFGLAHVLRIIQEHGGKIVEDGTFGTGARFKVLLPTESA